MINTNDIRNWVSKLEQQVDSLNSTSSSAAIILLTVVLVAYGYEIFGFHLTIDEELHADYTGQVTGWYGQGRWGMGILSAILIPATVTPAVSTALGVGLSALAWFLILRDVYKFTVIDATFACAVAITVPVMPFAIMFSTLAYGVGIANICVWIFAAHLARQSEKDLLLAIFFGALAIAIYQTFIFGLVVIGLFEIFRSHFFNRVRTIFYSVLAIVGSGLFYMFVDIGIRYFGNIPATYVGNFIDLAGFLHSPFSKVLDSVMRVADVMVLSEARFGLHSPWLPITMIAATTAILLSIEQQDRRMVLFRDGVLLAVLLLPVAADAMSTNGAPIRSGVYYPIIALALLGVAFSDSKGLLRLVLMSTSVLAIIGNAAISNRLFGSSEIALQLDKQLAYQVLVELGKQLPEDVPDVVRKLEIVGYKAWPENRLMPRKESFGKSFFEWNEGNRYRVAAFLRLSGVAVIGADDSERARVYDMASIMPAWPKPGWAKLDSATLILKFGDYTTFQRQSLCAAGATNACSLGP